ncbi:MAG: nucleolar complex protein 14, partial [Watsoniomyces obsoletus]
MPPSQLKQLKASLHQHGVLGPQKSKKQRKATAKDAQKRTQRNAALESIRERFNPFETKTSARPQKYQVVSNKDTKKPVDRPGVTRGLGEERRRETLLRELQTRNK